MAVEGFASFVADVFRAEIPRCDVCCDPGARGDGQPAILYSVLRSMTKR